MNNVNNEKHPGGWMLGVGIDMVTISEIRKIIENTKGAFVQRTFTDSERAEGEKERDPACYYAGRFAVKEAVFKATAHLLPEKTFDFRLIETLRNADGSPKVEIGGELKQKFQAAGIDDILVSISNEKDTVIAIANAVCR